MPFREWQTARTLEQALALLENGCEHLNFHLIPPTNIRKAKVSPTRTGSSANLGSTPSPVSPHIESLFEALKQNTRCRGLSLSKTRIRKGEIEALLSLLEYNKTLEYIKLGFLSDGCVDELIWLIKSAAENPVLTELHLPYSTMCEENMLRVVEALKSNPNLRVLSFGGGEIPETITSKLNSILAERIEADVLPEIQPIGATNSKRKLKVFPRRKIKRTDTNTADDANDDSQFESKPPRFDDEFLRTKKPGIGNVLKSMKLSSRNGKTGTMKSFNKSMGTLRTVGTFGTMKTTEVSAENPLFKNPT